MAKCSSHLDFPESTCLCRNRPPRLHSLRRMLEIFWYRPTQRGKPTRWRIPANEGSCQPSFQHVPKVLLSRFSDTRRAPTRFLRRHRRVDRSSIHGLLAMVCPPPVRVCHTRPRSHPISFRVLIDVSAIASCFAALSGRYCLQ